MIEKFGFFEEEDKRKKSENEKKLRKQYEEYLKAKKKTEEELSFWEYKKKLEYIQVSKNISSELQKEIQILKNKLDSLKISFEEIKDVLAKIKQIEEINNIDEYLPKEYRITLEEYKKSLIDPVCRQKTIHKLNKALNILVQHINVVDNILYMFTGYLLLDKNLQLLQENHIDIKNSLMRLD
jgi:arginine utilization protein RocB